MPFGRRGENDNTTALYEQNKDRQTGSLAIDHLDVKGYLEQGRRIAVAKDLLSSSYAETVASSRT